MVGYWRVVLAAGPRNAEYATKTTVWLWGTMTTCLERAIYTPVQRRGWEPGAVLSITPCDRQEYTRGKALLAALWPLQGGIRAGIHSSRRHNSSLPGRSRPARRGRRSPVRPGAAPTKTSLVGTATRRW